MELLPLAAIALLVLTALVLVYRRRKATAWDRELEEAFGVDPERELPRRRGL